MRAADGPGPLPVVREMAGWAVAESIKWLLGRAQAMGACPPQCSCRELVDVLQRPTLYMAAFVLDQMGDTPRSDPYWDVWENLRQEYRGLCDAISDAGVLLFTSMAEVSKSGSSGVHGQILKSDCEAVCAALQTFCRSDKYAQLYHSLKSAPERRVQHVCRLTQPLPPLQLKLPIRTSHPIMEPVKATPAQHDVFQHDDDLVPRIVDLLRSTRNIGIVGMGGIGKTSVANSAFRRARADTSRYDKAVWLEVGPGTLELTEILKKAFAVLFPDYECPFSDAVEGLHDLTRRVYEEKWRTLLVLDGVWPSTQHAVVAALNFATRPELRVAGSRLVVTTRQQDTLSYAPHGDCSQPMDELTVVEVPLLDDIHAQQLLFHHAFGESDAGPRAFVKLEECDKLVNDCAGIPRALVWLGEALRDCESRQQWEACLAELAQQRVRGDDPVSSACTTSIVALAPTVRGCLLGFASFPPTQAMNAIDEASLLQMFAASSPLHAPHTMRAVARKLAELERHSLIRRVKGKDDYVLQLESMNSEGNRRCEFYVPSHVFGVVLRQCEQLPTRCVDTIPSPEACGRIHNFSYRHPVRLPQELRPFEQLRTCMASSICTVAGMLPMRRLRYLHLCGDVDTKGDSDSASECIKDLGPHLVILNTLSFSNIPGADVYQMLETLPASELVNLVVRCCRNLSSLPDVIERYTRLTQLDLRGCENLECLPEGIGSCPQLALIDLSSCTSLKELPETLGDCMHLTCLNLSGCKSLADLPKRIGECRRLAHVTGCEGLKRLTDNIGDCRQLTHLAIHSPSLRQLPDSMGGCEQLVQLDLSGCEALKELPESMGHCTRLASLTVYGCLKLKLPQSLTHLASRNVDDHKAMAQVWTFSDGNVLHFVNAMVDLPVFLHGAREKTHHAS